MNTVGVYKARYWVKDLYGNISDTIERTIQVEINQVGPTVTLLGPDTVYVEAQQGSYIEQGAVAVDNVGDSITSRIVRIGMVDTAFIGTYYINYSVRDEFGFTGEKTRVVIVRKTVLPRLSVQDLSGIVKHQINTPYLLGSGLVLQDDYFAIDQLTLTQIGSPNTSVPGSYFIQVRLCDPLNNCTPLTQVQIDVQDTIAPVVSLLGANPLVVDVYNQNYADPGVNASDNYYSENSLIRIVDNKVDVNKLGTYTITYIVRDGANNSTEVKRQVNVVDRIAPVIELLGGDPFDLVWNDTFEMANEVRITDNYYNGEDLLALVQKTTTLNVDAVTGKYYGGTRGWKEITYQVTDPSNNQSNKARRRVYVDFRTGLNDVNKDQMVSTYPNPSTGKFTISTKENMTGKTEATLYNVLGAKVYSQTINMSGKTAEINAEGLPSGIYLLQLTNNGKQYSQRVTVK
jgi:hypothetical protein